MTNLKTLSKKEGTIFSQGEGSLIGLCSQYAQVNIWVIFGVSVIKMQVSVDVSHEETARIFDQRWTLHEHHPEQLFTIFECLQNHAYPSPPKPSENLWILSKISTSKTFAGIYRKSSLFHSSKSFQVKPISVLVAQTRSQSPEKLVDWCKALTCCIKKWNGEAPEKDQ